MTILYRRVVREYLLEGQKMRTPLKDRINEEWTPFESELFNLISRSIRKEYPEYTEDNLFLFSKRLSLTQHLLDAFDDYILKAKQ